MRRHLFGLIVGISVAIGIIAGAWYWARDNDLRLPWTQTVNCQDAAGSTWPAPDVYCKSSDLTLLGVHELLRPPIAHPLYARAAPGPDDIAVGVGVTMVAYLAIAGFIVSRRVLLGSAG